MRRRPRSASTPRCRSTSSTRLMGERSPTSPRSGCPPARPGCRRSSTAGSARFRARERQGVEAPRVQHDLDRGARPRCASSRTRASWRRCAAPPPSAPARMRGRCAFAPSASAAIRRPAFPSTRSRPSCCTSSAATAPTARPTARSSPPAATPACSTTRRRARELRAGELCLIDAGCELDGYASDVTRTFPADGRFTPAQRELYEIVEAAQAAALAATRPGARQRDAHAAAVRVLAQGMLDTGLLDRAQGRRPRRGDRVGRLPPVLHARHRPLARPRRPRRRRLPLAPTRRRSSSPTGSAAGREEARRAGSSRAWW